MPFPNCHNRSNPNNRKSLASAYVITPLAHTKLLPGQKLTGCCGPIKDECYTFSYQNKSAATDTGLFSVGRHCALDFLTLIGQSAPPCFNPLTSPSSSGGGGAASAASSSTMCALNIEVYQAVNLLTLDWGPPKASLQTILTAIFLAPTSAISNNHVIHLNNIIGKDHQGRKFAAIITALKAMHPNMRIFTFPNIQAVLFNANKASNF
ncbi:hypothetical protein [Acidovorax sp. NCPPB 3576]|uniref:hypothetical protein n=1 Tax=Acidovorax sp. NCPPB 3576 TaxID=2940488 RepID=UPI00234BBB26|nr:hypothetical protein [Acidovorax sp. NCPPB 3576]WCM89862.1 hypothetical protein M5C98_07500 [Acidovorax sp. NCPPB 3576]